MLSSSNKYQQRTGLPVTAALDNATMTALEIETAKQRPESLSASDTSLSDLPQEITTRLGIELVLIPAGEFQMGSYEGGDDERPVHRVRITEPFYMGKYEVTQAKTTHRSLLTQTGTDRERTSKRSWPRYLTS
jgi:formylglycine-generating enzyme required for sulfatase activity